jgi:hypothetical protein
MNQLKECILQQVSIEESSMERILSRFTPLELRKDEYFLQSGTVSALCKCYDNADALLDRLVHDAHRIEIDGDSLRKKRKFINQ